MFTNFTINSNGMYVCTLTSLFNFTLIINFCCGTTPLFIKDNMMHCSKYHAANITKIFF